jgi:hypothetical protein
VRFFLEKSRMDRFEKLNAIVRWTIAREGLTERNIYLFFSLREEKMQTNLAGIVTTSDI